MLQSNQVLSFFRPRENGGDWSQRELAEFYRVENALIGSGVAIGTDRGVTDEGEPWFVFYRQDNEEVIVHFARIDGEYVVVSNLTEGVVRGRNFQTLVRELLESHPYVLPKSNSRRQTVYLHPATLLAALVVTGYVKSAELNGDSDDNGRAEKGTGWVFNRHDLVTYSAIVIAAIWDTLTADSSVDKFSDFSWLDQTNVDHHDMAELSAASQSADGNALLGDLVFRNVHDQSLLAATTFNFEEHGATQNAQSSTTSEAKGFANAAVSHLGDGDQPVASHEPSRLEKDGDGKSGNWHADQEQADLLKGNMQPDRVGVAKSGSSTVPSEVSTSSESHNPSTSSTPATASSSPILADSSRAQEFVSGALHTDLQSLNPLVLAATSLPDAIQKTLLELNFSPGVITPVVDFSSASSPHLFDDAAQARLDEFLHQTAHFRVVTEGKDIILVDTDVSHSAFNQVESWTLADGSTISIIGMLSHHDAAA